MLIYDLKMAWRSLWAQKGYTVITLGGLALGLATCMVMVIFMHHEVGYDRYHERADRVYRVAVETQAEGRERNMSQAPVPLAETLKSTFPQVVHATQLLQHETYRGIPVIQTGDDAFLEHHLLYADSSIAEVFSFEWIQGNPATALDQPLSVVLSASTAQKYFGEEEPLGRTVTFQRQNDSQTLTVTGVVADLPNNTHLRFDLLVHADLHPFRLRLDLLDNWVAHEAWTYIVIDKGTTVASLAAQLPAVVDQYFPKEVGEEIRLMLQPLPSIHLDSNYGDEIQANGSRTFLALLAMVAAFVLAIACINFINLTTARSVKRSKEVGVRKALGAHRSTLIAQLLSEAVLVSFGATVMALGLAEAALPLFTEQMGLSSALSLGNERWLIGLLFVVGLGLGLLAGLYPAWSLASRHPVAALKKERLTGSTRSAWLRKSLVVSQFAISLALLVAVGVIQKQQHFIQNKDLGFQKEQVAFVRLQGDLYAHVGRQQAFLENVRSHDAVVAASGSWSLPGSVQAPVFNYLFRLGSRPPNERTRLSLIRADPQFASTFGLDIIAGRALSPDIANDESHAFLVSEAAAQALAGKDSPLGFELEVFSGSGNSFKTGQVVGVFKDIHHGSLYEDIQPLVISGATSQQYRYVSVRLGADRMSEGLAHLSDTWKQFLPEVPINVFFLDADVQRAYERVQQLQQFVQFFAALAIFIACVGLFGLAAYTAEQRTKEMGIRKVLGASVHSLVALLGMEFLCLIALAFCIVTPIIYVLMDTWLSTFAYRIALGADVFIGAGLLVAVLALAVVSYHAIKTALADPVVTLQHE